MPACRLAAACTTGHASAPSRRQLAVKGLLHGIGKAPWGHDHIALCAQLPEQGVELPNKIADSARRLGRHYIPARYPDAHGSGTAADHYGTDDSEQAISDAHDILQFTDASWDELNA